MSPFRRLMTRTATLIVTLAVAGAAAAAVAGVSILLAQRADSLPTPPRADPLPVRVVTSRGEDGYTLTRRFTGQIAPAAATDLGFETGGRIDWIGPQEGDHVAEGEVIARLDTRSQMADRNAALAERAALAARAELARLTADRQADLQARGHSAAAQGDDARLTLAALMAQIAAADARIAGIDLLLDKAALRAPFAAEIGTRHLDPGATVAAGTPVARLLSLRAPELRAGLPPDLAATLRPGDAVRVDLQGRAIPARVIRLRPDLSPATRTREVVLALDLPDGLPVPHGATATVLIPQNVQAEGQWLPLTALRDGPRGTWAVLVAAPDGAGGTLARPEAVEILHTDTTRVFLRGALPPGTPILAEGTHRVTPGQPVAPVAD